MAEMPSVHLPHPHCLSLLPLLVTSTNKVMQSLSQGPSYALVKPLLCTDSHEGSKRHKEFLFYSSHMLQKYKWQGPSALHTSRHSGVTLHFAETGFTHQRHQPITPTTLGTPCPEFSLNILTSIHLGKYTTAFLSKYELVSAKWTNFQSIYSSLKPLSFFICWFL